ADLRWIGFDQISGDGPIDHGDVKDLDENQKRKQWHIGIRRNGSGNQLPACVWRQWRQGRRARDWVSLGLEGDYVVAGRTLHRVIDRIVSNNSKQTTGQYDFLAADFVGERAEYSEKRHGEKHRQGHDNEAGPQAQFQDRLEIKQRIILA